MKRLQFEITIGNFRVEYCNNVTINSSWQTFTDTASIILPNTFRLKGKTILVGIDNVFKRGDKVTIKTGYFPNLTTRFEGYISRVKPDSPLVLDCEDQMWLLKQVNLVTKLFTDPTIKEVIEYATVSQTGLGIDYDDETAKIGNFHVDNKGFINAVKVFEVLKKQFGYNIYFKDGRLQVRAINSILALGSDNVKFGMQFNVISDNLTYQRDDDVDIQVRFESRQSDNSVLTYYGYKTDGEAVINTTAKTAQVTHSWKIPGLTVAQIKRIITDNLDKFVWEGYTGGFTTFLEPVVVPGNKIQIIDKEHPEREGVYMCTGVNVASGVDGGRQVVEIRNKVG